MKKPALTLLAVVLPIAVLLALWFTLDESGRGGRGAGSEHAREHAPIASPAVELAERLSAPSRGLDSSKLYSNPSRSRMTASPSPGKQMWG